MELLLVYYSYYDNQYIIFNNLVGFGDYTPKTMIGRIISIFCCILGVFLLSLVVVILMLFITLNEDELKAYEDISIMTSKERKNNVYTHYFDKFLQVKINMLLKNKAHIQDIFINKNHFKIIKERLYLRVRSRMIKSSRISDFGNSISDLWEDKYLPIIDTIISQVDTMSPITEHISDVTGDHIAEIKFSKELSFRLFNFMRMFEQVGCHFEISSLDEIKGNHIINDNDLDQLVKEFIIKNRELWMPGMLKGSIHNLPKKKFLQNSTNNLKVYTGNNSESSEFNILEKSDYDSY